MTPNVPTSDSGTATLGMMVAATVRRKRKITMTTSAMTSISSNSTSWTEARIVVVRSVRIATSMAEGSDARSCGRSCLTRSTTAMMFAPGWRWMFRITAGTSFIQAACFRFSVSSMTLAMSERWMGEPFLYATTSGRYCSEDRSWSLAPIE